MLALSDNNYALYVIYMYVKVKLIDFYHPYIPFAVVEFTLSLRDRSPIVGEGNIQLTFNLTKEGEATRNVYIVVRTQDGSTAG